MKKKVFIILLFAMLALSVNSIFAQDIDLTKLSFEELETLKFEIEKEFNTRDEAQPFIIKTGTYIIGVDFEPGTYWFYNPQDCDTCYADCIISDKNGKELDRIVVQAGKTKRVVIENAYSIQSVGGESGFSKKEIDVSKINEYQMPDGTFVEAGIYYVGEDIPAGRYNILPSSRSGSRVFVYANTEDLQNDANPVSGAYVKPGSTETMSIKLNEGEVVAALTSFIITKASAIEIK